MFPSVMVFAVTFSIWGLVSGKQTSSRSRNLMKGHVIIDRWKRMATIISAASFEGMRVARFLLQDAKQIFFSPSGKIYEKSGGYEQALKDFDLSKPRNIQQDPVHADMKRGAVGDREITIKKDGWLGKPTVYLIKNPGVHFRAGAIDTIVYKGTEKLD